MSNYNCNQNQQPHPRKPLIPVVWMLLFIAALNSAALGAYHLTESNQPPFLPQLPESEITIDVNSVVPLVFTNSPEVVAARYSLEAAQFQFKDFERKLSQFTPLVFDSSIRRTQRRFEENQAHSSRVGMEKEFFDGSSISTGIGHRGGFGDAGYDAGQFVDTAITFPLFGSNTTLRRITDRSREENEMFNAHLEYIDTIRDNIRRAQGVYFDFLCHKERLAKTLECLEDYKGLLQIPRTQSNPVQRRQVESEIQSLQSEVLRWKEHINGELLQLRLTTGMEELLPSQINTLDIYAKDYYGKSYLTRTADELLVEANNNDVEIRVLENAKKNSIEKKQLAEEGKWDIFVDIDAQYDMDGAGAFRDENGYFLGLGFRVRKIDSTLLGYSLRRAIAEINKYNALIRGQQLETKRQIDRAWFMANSRRKECGELTKSIDSRRKVYLQKRQDYADGKETIDNLIDSRRQLMYTQLSLTRCLEGFYVNIAILNHACGVYFTKLGVDIQ